MYQEKKEKEGKSMNNESRGLCVESEGRSEEGFLK